MKNSQRRRQARRSSKTTRQKQTRQGISFAWIWLLIGMFMGVLGISLVYQRLYQWPSIQALLPTQTNFEAQSNDLKSNKRQGFSASATGTKKNPKEKKELTSSRKHFEFYQLLPGMEVPISEANVSPAPTAVPTVIPASATIPPAKKEEPPLPPAAATMASAEKTKTPLKSPSKLPKVLRKLAAAQYLLQVDAFKSANTANALKARLISQGFAPRVYKVEAEDGVWFRVTLGPYPSEAMALKQKSLLERQKIHAILILQR